MPLAEFYTSLTLIEKYMANDHIIKSGHEVVADRWPLACLLLMATGSAKSPYAVSSPFPAKAFDDATWEASGNTYKMPLRTRGPDPILHSEYAAVFLREPDLCRLRYVLVTRDAQGQLAMCDPADIATAAGGPAARLAWGRGIGALPPWIDKVKKDERSSNCRNIALLNAAAVETMLAAAAELSLRKEEINREIYKMRK
ncbi:hypothetical protein GGS23DRAFT_601938 [Durotheca rogersii]|uniref:uncharacterized protein n=1 Tax=Durotheca rogersii TaxID=419775 RepID=UPI00221FE88C|nr:uncharacterized protein GGS23DRAFT_601938 [Durotheca rogersii]KAI5867961.1 hypothetical protein GGS23DRAFT_601938 [Durotheca rogersii]